MIYRFDTPEALSLAAAKLFVRQARNAVDARGRFNVALCGGRTPRRTYALLTQPELCDQTPWPRIHVFWGDERCVSPLDERSNALMAWRTLLEHVPVSADNVHPIRCEASAEAGARRYDALLRQHFSAGESVLDLVFLGLGSDGHTASLFPQSPTLVERRRWALHVHPAGQEMWRVTMPPALINVAHLVVFLVVGAEKASILKTVLEDQPENGKLPAHYIAPDSGKLIWMADGAAFRQLSHLKHTDEVKIEDL
jgi:6-phosphogluconolactonase